jgi:MFS family permease
VLLHAVIPTPKKELFHVDSEINPSFFKRVLTNPDLLRLNAGIFCQHFILTATFFVIPMILQDQLAEGHLSRQWQFYLPLMFFSFVMMVPLIVLGEKKQRMKAIFISAVILTLVCQFLLIYTYQNWFSICVFMFLYFIAFNILEANLPSLISKQAATDAKGTAMGIYSSCQFLGIFLGGACAGVLYQHTGSIGVFTINTVIAALWLILSLTMKPFTYWSTLLLPYSSKLSEKSSLETLLRKIAGIKDAAIATEEGLIYLRINKAEYQYGSAEEALLNYKESSPHPPGEHEHNP